MLILNSLSWRSYVNIAITGNGTKKNNNLFPIAYVAAHELLHQLLIKADYHVNGISSTRSSYASNGSGHVNYPLNLNSDGGTGGLGTEMRRGHCSGSSCHLILPEHANLLFKFLSKK